MKWRPPGFPAPGSRGIHSRAAREAKQAPEQQERVEVPCTAGSSGRGNHRGEFGLGHGNRNIAKLQFFETRDDGAVLLLVFAFRAGGFDGVKDAAQDVHKGQQSADDRGIGRELALAQQAEEVFSGVRERFEAAEAEEAGCALNGMHGAENFRQQLRVAGACFKVGQAPLHAVQAFLAFEKEFASKVVHERFIGKWERNLRGGCRAGRNQLASETHDRHR
jgi:hypothetical protein